ncbi:hypothetical protein CAL7716_106220 (plasmid) [Calothrix sp. PCC 7716]|nr:hypothetical protein CAL7716_106220 [Calothrix sp. PCC 7716]
MLGDSWTRNKLISFIALSLILFVVRMSRCNGLRIDSDPKNITMTSGTFVLAISLAIRLFDTKVTDLLKEDIISLGIGVLLQIFSSFENSEVQKDIIFLWNKISSKNNKKPPSSPSNTSGSPPQASSRP